MTNFDRIKQMTLEEMVDFMEKLELQDVDFGMTFCGAECDMKQECNDCRKWWLKQPYHPDTYFSQAIAKEDNF